MAHRVVLVDDEEDVRKSLTDLIHLGPGMEVVAAVGTAAEAIDVLARFSAELVVVDLVLGDGPDGIQLTKALKARDPLLPVLILSGRAESLFAERALLAGASGYVMKDRAAEVLLEAMHTAIHYGLWLSADMEQRLLPPGLSLRDPHEIHDEIGVRLLAELRRGNRTVPGLARVMGLPLSVADAGLQALQGQLGVPSRAALLLCVR